MGKFVFEARGDSSNCLSRKAIEWLNQKIVTGIGGFHE